MRGGAQRDCSSEYLWNELAENCALYNIAERYSASGSPLFICIESVDYAGAPIHIMGTRLAILSNGSCGYRCLGSISVAWIQICLIEDLA